jgi:hypothetical protein
MIHRHNRAVTVSTLFARGSGSLFIAGTLFVAGCQTQNPVPTAHVDATTQDTTSASALWLQASIPNEPLQNVYLKGSTNSSSLSVEVNSNSVVSLTALASDNDSGITSVSLNALVTIERANGNSWFMIQNHVSRSFGGNSVPATIPGDFPLTMRATGTVDFNTLSAGADWVVVDIAAQAVSGAPPASGQPVETYTMVLYWKRPGSPPP